MKVLHVVESFAGGVYDFLKILTKHQPDIDHVIVHGFRADTPSEYADDFGDHVTFLSWPEAVDAIHPLRDFEAFLALRRIVKEEEPFDILHLHSSKAGFLGRLVARQLGISSKTLYTSHGVSFIRQDISKIKKAFFVFLEKIAARTGGTVVACSPSEKEAFRRHGIPAIAVPNGIECEKMPPQQTSKEIVIVATAGRITPAKGPELFDAVARKLENRRDIRFLWIGEGEAQDRLDADNIEITGWLKGNDFCDTFSKIDIYLSTSKWEGLPLAVLKAMCLGKPLILSRCIGNVDLVQNNGYLYDKIDEAVQKIVELAENRTLCKKLGSASRELLAHRYTADKTAKSYLDLYGKMKKTDR